MATPERTATTDPREDLLAAFGSDPSVLLARVADDPSRFPAGSIRLLERMIAGLSPRALSPTERGLLVEIVVEAERPVAPAATPTRAAPVTHSTPSATSPTAAPRSPTAPAPPPEHALPTAAFWWLAGGKGEEGGGGEADREPRTPRPRSSSSGFRRARRRR